MAALETIFFYILAAVLIVCSFGAILARRVISSLIFALVWFLGVGGIYFLLNATFNAAIQVLAYVSALLMLLFVAIIPFEKEKYSFWGILKPRIYISALSLLIIFVTLAWAIVDDYLVHILDIMSGGFTLSRSLSTVYTIGERLLTDYSVAFELVAFVMFILTVSIGMICVIKQNEEV